MNFLLHYFLFFLLGLSALSSALAAQPAPAAQPVKSFSGLFFTMIFALVVVLVLAFVLIRWILPKLLSARTLGQGGRLKILERYGLEPRKSLYLVELQGRRFLLGASEQNLNLLAELTVSGEEE